MCIQLINQLAKCQEITHGAEGAIMVYTERRYIIEFNNWRMKSDDYICLLYTSPSPRDATLSRMPSSA